MRLQRLPFAIGATFAFWAGFLPVVTAQQPATPADNSAVPAAAPAATAAAPAVGSQEAPVSQTAASRPETKEEDQALASAAVAACKAAPPPAEDNSKHKSKKDDYTGPNTIVELPPTPMLDEEGKQRLDPDGKPMFNPPVKQQRNKFGHPLFDASCKPVMQTATELGYDEHGKKVKAEKVKPPKMTPVTIARGTLSVDGMTARAALNYDIADLKYIYLYAPGIGTVVVSDEPFAGGTAQQHGFNDKTLTVNVGDHVLQLASDVRLLGKEPKPAYVLVDREFMLPSASPVMGYGTALKPPYSWPGAKPNPKLAGVDAPPVPVNMLPTLLLAPCPAGQMRRPAPRALPGQTPPPQPCVPISSLKSAQANAASTAPVAAGQPAARAEGQP